MLKKENEFRMSEKWIEKMEKEINEMEMDTPLAGYKYDLEKGSPVIMELQTEVVKSFGYVNDDEIKEAIGLLRSAQATYPDDDQVTNAANYLKYNRIEKGDFVVGEKVNTKDIEIIQFNSASFNDDNVNDDGQQENKANDDDEKNYRKLQLNDVLNKKNKNLNLLIALSVT